jgi:hypothetical protein
MVFKFGKQLHSLFPSNFLSYIDDCFALGVFKCYINVTAKVFTKVFKYSNLACGQLHVQMEYVFTSPFLDGEEPGSVMLL